MAYERQEKARPSCFPTVLHSDAIDCFVLVWRKGLTRLDGAYYT